MCPFSIENLRKGAIFVPILKNRTQSNFTQISNSILRDQELPMKERGVLCTLLSFPDKWDFSVEGLSAIVPDGRDALNKAIKNLIAAGYVRRNQIRDNAGKYAVELEVEDHRGALLTDTDTCLPLRKNRSGSAVTDNTDTESTVTVKPTQYNNDIYNTDLYNINQSNNQILSQGNDGLRDGSTQKKSLVSLEKLRDDFEYSELMQYEIASSTTRRDQTSADHELGKLESQSEIARADRERSELRKEDSQSRRLDRDDERERRILEARQAAREEEQRRLEAARIAEERARAEAIAAKERAREEAERARREKSRSRGRGR